jgi:hypothetical protein
MRVSESGAEATGAVSVRFMIDADSSPCLVPRLLAPFARRNLIPDRMWSHRDGDSLHVELAMHAMPGEVVHLIEGNLRQVVGVRNLVQVRPRIMLQAA